MKNDFRRTESAYPEEMRTQLWPLCCGASILSGFKNAGNVTDEQLVSDIENACMAIPDGQVYSNEKIIPRLTYLTLNYEQILSTKIMDAVRKAGFVMFAKASPRGHLQAFFVRDTSNTFKLVSPATETVAPVAKVSKVAA